MCVHVHIYNLCAIVGIKAGDASIKDSGQVMEVDVIRAKDLPILNPSLYLLLPVPSTELAQKRHKSHTPGVKIVLFRF